MPKRVNIVLILIGRWQVLSVPCILHLLSSRDRGICLLLRNQAVCLNLVFFIKLFLFEELRVVSPLELFVVFSRSSQFLNFLLILSVLQSHGPRTVLFLSFRLLWGKRACWSKALACLDSGVYFEWCVVGLIVPRSRHHDPIRMLLRKSLLSRKKRKRPTFIFLTLILLPHYARTPSSSTPARPRGRSRVSLHGCSAGELVR